MKKRVSTWPLRLLVALGLVLGSLAGGLYLPAAQGAPPHDKGAGRDQGTLQAWHVRRDVVGKTLALTLLRMEITTPANIADMLRDKEKR